MDIFELLHQEVNQAEINLKQAENELFWRKKALEFFIKNGKLFETAKASKPQKSNSEIKSIAPESPIKSTKPKSKKAKKEKKNGKSNAKEIVVDFLVNHGDASVDEILHHLNENGVVIQMASLRSTLSRWKKDGVGIDKVEGKRGHWEVV